MTTTEQPSFFDPRPALSHRSDPETSRRAANNPKNMARWSGQKRTLLLVFQGRPDGLTPDAAGRLCGIGNYNERRRCSDLVAGGWLERTGEDIGGVGVLRITELGREALMAVAK